MKISISWNFIQEFLESVLEFLENHDNLDKSKINPITICLYFISKFFFLFLDMCFPPQGSIKGHDKIFSCVLVQNNLVDNVHWLVFDCLNLCAPT